MAPAAKLGGPKALPCFDYVAILDAVIDTADRPNIRTNEPNLIQLAVDQAANGDGLLLDLSAQF